MGELGHEGGLHACLVGRPFEHGDGPRGVASDGRPRFGRARKRAGMPDRTGGGVGKDRLGAQGEIVRGARACDQGRNACLLLRAGGMLERARREAFAMRAVSEQEKTLRRADKNGAGVKPLGRSPRLSNSVCMASISPT